MNTCRSSGGAQKKNSRGVKAIRFNVQSSVDCIVLLTEDMHFKKLLTVLLRE